MLSPKSSRPRVAIAGRATLADSRSCRWLEVQRSRRAQLKWPHGDGSLVLRAIAARFEIRPRTARLEQALYTALAVLAGFNPRHSTGQIDHQSLAPQHILTLRHYNRITRQCDGIVFHVEDAELARGSLILLR